MIASDIVIPILSLSVEMITHNKTFSVVSTYRAITLNFLMSHRRWEPSSGGVQYTVVDKCWVLSKTIV